MGKYIQKSSSFEGSEMEQPPYGFIRVSSQEKRHNDLLLGGKL